MDFTWKEILMVVFSGIGTAILIGGGYKFIVSRRDSNKVVQKNVTVTNGDNAGRDINKTPK